MNPKTDRRIECEIHRKDLHVRIVDIALDKAILTYIVAGHTYSATERHAKRIGKEVWNELGNLAGERWPEENIQDIIQTVKICLGVEPIGN